MAVDSVHACLLQCDDDNEDDAQAEVVEDEPIRCSVASSESPLPQSTPTAVGNISDEIYRYTLTFLRVNSNIG